MGYRAVWHEHVPCMCSVQNARARFAVPCSCCSIGPVFLCSVGACLNISGFNVLALGNMCSHHRSTAILLRNIACGTLTLTMGGELA